MDGESGYRICMMSFLIAGVVMLWTGFNYLLVSFRPDLFTPDSYNMMKIVLSLVLIIMSMLMSVFCYAAGTPASTEIITAPPDTIKLSNIYCK